MSIITIPKPNPNAKMQLLCLPFAGGGSRFFFNWHKELPNFEICLVSYPGREHRMAETAITDVDILIDVLFEACRKIINKDFVIFGHSMGSIVSYGLTKKLELSKIIPHLLLVSSAAAPNRPLKKENMLSLLPDDKFINLLVKRYNAIPEIILKDSNLMKLFAPILRNDISIEEQYISRHGQNTVPLLCNLRAFGGIDDMAVNKYHLMTWKDLTKGTFAIKMFPGGHFYLNENSALLFQEISKECSS